MAHTAQRILTVDDEAPIREIVRRGLEKKGHQVWTASSVAEARKVMAEHGPFSLILCDINMPGEKGTVLLQENARLAPNTGAWMATAVQEIQVAIQALKSGAYDYLLKPFDVEVLQMTVGRALERRTLELQAREHRDELERLVAERTRALQTRNTELVTTQRAVLRALCAMGEFRDPETGRHLERMAVYAQTLARELGARGLYRNEVDDAFVSNIFDATPLHDLGTIGIPDMILMKPGAFTEAERTAMQRHTIIGRDTLRTVRDHLPPSSDRAFIEMAVDIAASHHERWDGTGYPAKLKGTEIPLSARIVALADYYDACTSARVYRPEPIAYDVVLQSIHQLKGKFFDPVVVDAFTSAEPAFSAVRDDLAD